MWRPAFWNLQRIYFHLANLNSFKQQFLGMGFEEIPVVKRHVPDNPKVVGENTKFTGIAEMVVDVHLVRMEEWIAIRMP